MAENENKNAMANLGYNDNSFAVAMNEKKLNKFRNAKSSLFGILVGIGGLLAVTALLMDGKFRLIMLAVVCFVVAFIVKATASANAKKYNAYEKIVDPDGNTSIYDVAAGTGEKASRVTADLQKMIDLGFFHGAYIDKENMLIVMTKDGKAIASVEESAEASQKARLKAAREGGLVPESMDDMMLMTDDSEIKNKLGELKTIMDKIDARVAEKPELAKDVKEYNEKFFPEVVRLSDAYNQKIAKLSSRDESKADDDTEIKLKEDSLAKQKEDIKNDLVKMIDKVIEASDNLLEKLYEEDIMDISSDIKSVETTIASKGLLDSDFDITI